MDQMFIPGDKKVAGSVRQTEQVLYRVFLLSYDGRMAIFHIFLCIK